MQEIENKKRFVKRLRLKKEVKKYLNDLVLDMIQLIFLFVLPWIIVLLHVLVYC